MLRYSFFVGRAFLWIATCSVIAASPASAETWREIRSPHFRVVTDGSEREGRDVAKEFEQMRWVFTTALKDPVLETAAPLTIVAVREEGLRSLSNSFWKDRDRIAGEFFTGWERKYAMVRLDTFGDLNQAVVFHEYTHSIYHANVHWMPLWLDEGLAELYGYTQFRSGHVYVGAPSIRMGHLRSESLIPVPKMLTATQSTFGKDERMNDLFYGESWAMVHYMTFGENMGGGALLGKYLSLLESGKTQTDAFQQVFGDPKAFESKLSDYINRLTIRAALLPAADAIDEKSFSARVLSEAEKDYVQGSIDVGAHAFQDGKAKMDAAVAADPTLAGAHEELGFQAWRIGKDDEAKAEWKKALATDASCYRSEFALLMSETSLKDETPEQLARTKLALDAIHAKEPKYAPVLVETALVQWRLGQILDAYKSALAAEKLEPWRAEYHLLTGHILLRGKQPKVTEQYARNVALRWPGSDHDEAVELWNLVPAAVRTGGPPMTLSYPSDASVVHGTIVSTACEKTGFNVVVHPSDGKSADVTATANGGFENGFADTLWFGEDHYTPCYHLAGLPAVVVYKAAAGGVNKLQVFEVKDDLPDMAAPVQANATTSSTATAAHP